MKVASLKLTLTLTLSLNPKLTLALRNTGGHTEYMKVASLKLTLTLTRYMQIYLNSKYTLYLKIYLNSNTNVSSVMLSAKGGG